MKKLVTRSTRGLQVNTAVVQSSVSNTHAKYVSLMA